MERINFQVIEKKCKQNLLHKSFIIKQVRNFTV